MDIKARLLASSTYQKDRKKFHYISHRNELEKENNY